MAAGDQNDPHLVSALKKRRGGQPLTQREQNALAKFERAQREKFGLAYVKETPKKDLLAEVDVSNKTWLEWVDEFGAPWSPHSKTADSFALLRWSVGLIRECASAIRKHRKTVASKAAIDEFLPDVTEGTDWQDECFKEKALALRDDRYLREKALIDAAAFADVMLVDADGFRMFVEQLGKAAGPDLGPQLQTMALKWWTSFEGNVHRLLVRDDGNRS